MRQRSSKGAKGALINYGQEMQEMRKRALPIIHIIGLPGAGKTTLAQRLSKALKIPILRIGYHRVRFSMTPIGEADAWVGLFRELSRHRWKNCILETTGLNSREDFLRVALPFEQMFTIKLEASRKTLFSRIRKKRKGERNGQWFYSVIYKNKYEFVRKLFKPFRKIPADYRINTNRLDEIAVYRKALKEIKFMGGIHGEF